MARISRAKVSRVSSLLSTIRSKFHAWTAVAALVVAVGVVVSSLGAQSLANNDAATSQRALQATAGEITSNVAFNIAREQDFLIGAAAFVADNPSISEAQFTQRVRAIWALDRFPEIISSAMVTVVPGAQLAQFQARHATWGATEVPGGPRLGVTPSGSRPYYCLAQLQATRVVKDAPPLGLDYCAGALGAVSQTTRDLAIYAYAPFAIAKKTYVEVIDPIYANGALPATVGARRKAFIGWMNVVLDPKVMLGRILDSHPGIALSLVYHTPTSNVTISDGNAPKGSHLVTTNLHQGWRTQTYGYVSSASIIGDGDALALLLGGIALSVFLAGVIDLLGSGRARAEELVRTRTEELRYQALHDSLTGLPNRALILDRIEHMLARARSHGLSCAVLFLDLDDFKGVNDTMGHRTGDALLAAVGARLAGTIRGEDTVGRLGGDEFVILVEGPSLDAGIEVVSDRILDVLSTPFEIPGSDATFRVNASIGIAMGDRARPEELLRDADIALYRAKAAGKRRAVIFATEMQSAVTSRHMLGVELDIALACDEFFLLYQPIFNLESNAITGVEALLRWNHREKGVIEPESFIHELEETGLIIPLGRKILHQACRQGAAWCAEGHRISVAINVSGKQLEVPQLLDDVRDALEESGFEAELLILEMTETVLMRDAEMVAVRLQQLKSLGVRLAIDDFGTGYSSLAYLRQFPVDVLKIDRSFVSEVGDSQESMALIHTLAQLGKVLGLETVAEGIETDLQRQRLKDEEVETGQGYLFSRPIAPDAVGRLLGLLDPLGEAPKRARFDTSDFRPYRSGEIRN